MDGVWEAGGCLEGSREWRPPARALLRSTTWCCMMYFVDRQVAGEAVDSWARGYTRAVVLPECSNVHDVGGVGGDSVLDADRTSVGKDQGFWFDPQAPGRPVHA